jgi:hypothetical protein
MQANRLIGLRDTINPDRDPVSCPICAFWFEGGLEAFLHAIQCFGDDDHMELALQIARSAYWGERRPDQRGAFA